VHFYSINNDSKATFIALFAIISVPIAYFFHLLLVSYNIQIWWIDSPSILAVWGGIYKIFDKYLWCLFPGAINLSGKWDGFIHSSHDQNQNKKAVKVKIKQTWSRISIRLESDISKSKSLAASFILDDDGYSTLSYEFLNEPQHNAMAAMHTHRGTCLLEIKNKNLMNGFYYTGRGRQTTGAIELEKGS